MGKITIVKNVNKFKELASNFEGNTSAWKKYQAEFTQVYLPSAIHHYLANGDMLALNRIRNAAVITKAASTFCKLVDPIGCNPFDKSTGRYISVRKFAEMNKLSGEEQDKLIKKYKSKRASLQKIDQATGNPRWLDSYTERLDRIENTNSENSKRTFEENVLALVTRVVNLANSEQGQKSAELQAIAKVASEVQPVFENKIKKVA